MPPSLRSIFSMLTSSFIRENLPYLQHTIQVPSSLSTSLLFQSHPIHQPAPPGSVAWRPPTAYKWRSAKNLSATADTGAIRLDSNAVKNFLKIFHRVLLGVDILGLRIAAYTLLLDWH